MERRRTAVPGYFPSAIIGTAWDDRDLSVSLLVALLLGAVAPFVPLVRRVVRIAATIVHEVGHVVVVVPFGGRIRRIELHPDGSGEAWVELARVPRPLRGPVRILNLFAGYSAPVWAGVVLVDAAVQTRAVLPVLVLGVVGVVALLFVRNWFGLLVVCAFDGLAAWIVLRPSGFADFVAAGVGALLLVEGVLAVIRVTVWLATRAAVTTDFHIAARETRVPTPVWLLLFFVMNAAICWLLRGQLAALGAAILSGLPVAS